VYILLLLPFSKFLLYPYIFMAKLHMLAKFLRLIIYLIETTSQMICRKFYDFSKCPDWEPVKVISSWDLLNFMWDSEESITIAMSRTWLNFTFLCELLLVYCAFMFATVFPDEFSLSSIIALWGSAFRKLNLRN
jgi:hypothetical protein